MRHQRHQPLANSQTIEQCSALLSGQHNRNPVVPSCTACLRSGVNFMLCCNTSFAAIRFEKMLNMLPISGCIVSMQRFESVHWYTLKVFSYCFLTCNVLYTVSLPFSMLFYLVRSKFYIVNFTYVWEREDQITFGGIRP